MLVEKLRVPATLGWPGVPIGPPAPPQAPPLPPRVIYVDPHHVGTPPVNNNSTTVTPKVVGPNATTDPSGIASEGFMGLDNMTLLLIGSAIIAVIYFIKKK